MQFFDALERQPHNSKCSDLSPNLRASFTVRLDMTFIAPLCSRRIDADAGLTTMYAVEHGYKSYIGWLPTACGCLSRELVLVFVENVADNEYGFRGECAAFCALRRSRQCFVTTAHRPAVTQFVCTSTASKNPIVQSACVSMTQEGREDVIEKIRP